MEVSRRAFLGSAGAIAFRPPQRLAVSCTLEESRVSFQALPAFSARAAGSPALVESSVGFAAEDLTWLRPLGISVGTPVPVTGPAWVRFHWPVPAMIRDFGRVCIVTGGEVIARLGPIPVAIRRGPLIVLGSPLGPHIYAGDPDARLLLEHMMRSSL